MFKNNPKDLDLSYKTALDLWNCFGRENLSYNKITWCLFSYKTEFPPSRMTKISKSVLI